MQPLQGRCPTGASCGLDTGRGAGVCTPIDTRTGWNGVTTGKATLIGFTAIAMWALLAMLTILTAPVPPFLLNALCFGIGGAIGLVWTARRGFGVLRGVPWTVYAFGTLGLFGYHALYFTAFRIAPTAETGLIAYLWPLFIVLFSGLLPGERLHPLHIIGALLGRGHGEYPKAQALNAKRTKA